MFMLQQALALVFQLPGLGAPSSSGPAAGIVASEVTSRYSSYAPGDAPQACHEHPHTRMTCAVQGTPSPGTVAAYSGSCLPWHCVRGAWRAVH